MKILSSGSTLTSTDPSDFTNVTNGRIDFSVLDFNQKNFWKKIDYGEDINSTTPFKSWAFKNLKSRAAVRFTYWLIVSAQPI